MQPATRKFGARGAWQRLSGRLSEMSRILFAACSLHRAEIPYSNQTGVVNRFNLELHLDHQSTQLCRENETSLLLMRNSVDLRLWRLTVWLTAVLHLVRLLLIVGALNRRSDAVTVFLPRLYRIIHR